MKYFKYLLLLLFCFVTSVSADTTYKQGVIAKGVTDVYVRKCASSHCDRILSDTGSKISISYPRAFEIRLDYSIVDFGMKDLLLKEIVLSRLWMLRNIQ